MKLRGLPKKLEAFGQDPARYAPTFNFEASCKPRFDLPGPRHRFPERVR